MIRPSTKDELLTLAKTEITRYKKILDKVASFCCEIENKAYDMGMEDTIKPITNKILKIIMIKPTFIIKCNEPITEEAYEILVQEISGYTSKNGMYLDDVLEEKE
jgi:hypothetical protein